MLAARLFVNALLLVLTVESKIQKTQESIEHDGAFPGFYLCTMLSARGLGLL